MPAFWDGISFLIPVAPGVTCPLSFSCNPSRGYDIDTPGPRENAAYDGCQMLWLWEAQEAGNVKQKCLQYKQTIRY